LIRLGSFYLTGSAIADMDANDTATFQFRHDQGASSQVTVNQEYTFVGWIFIRIVKMKQLTLKEV